MRETFLTIFVAALIAVGSTPAYSQDSTAKADKTGTNPINFSFDARVYNEFTWLEGDGEKNVSTFEFRMPLIGGKLQFRTRIRGTSLEADLNGDGSNDVDEFGLGEVDFRFLTVPYLNMKKKMAIAVGLETFLPTGNRIVGSERLSFGPQVFGVFFAPFGIKNSLIAPAYQHKFSVWEDDVDSLHQSLFDVFFLKQSADKQQWMLVNPQFIIDHKTNVEFGFVDVEVGTMLDKYLGTKGHSIYFRPSIGFGPDRVSDGSIEAGYKIIW